MKTIGIIGLGMASAPHARSLQDLKERVAVKAAFSPSAARRQSFAEATGFPVVDCADAVLGDPSIDAVLLLTPPNTHLDLVRQAASAGKHVLLEKPLEISLERAEELVAVADAAGIKLGVVLQHRFRPVSVALGGLIREGRLGEIVSASARRLQLAAAELPRSARSRDKSRDGGDVLLTQAIDTLDLMMSLGLPVEVTGYAVTSPVHDMETGDLAIAATRYSNGGIGHGQRHRPLRIPASLTPWTSSVRKVWRASRAAADRVFPRRHGGDRRRWSARRRCRRRSHGLPAPAPPRRDPGLSRRNRQGR